MKTTHYTCDWCGLSALPEQVLGWVFTHVFLWVSTTEPKFQREMHYCPDCANPHTHRTAMPRSELPTLPDTGKRTSAG